MSGERMKVPIKVPWGITWVPEDSPLAKLEQIHSFEDELKEAYRILNIPWNPKEILTRTENKGPLIHKIEDMKRCILDLQKALSAYD